MTLRTCNNCTRVECKGIASVGPCGKYKAPTLPSTPILMHLISTPKKLTQLYKVLEAFKMKVEDKTSYPGFKLIY